MTSHPSELAEACRLRATAKLENHAGQFAHDEAARLYGRGLHADAKRFEAVAIEREDEAVRLNLRAALIEANLKSRAGLFEVAGEITQGVG